MLRTACLLLLVAVTPLTGDAQRGGRGADSSRWMNSEMERRIQQRMGAILKEQLRLTDAQVKQMQDVNFQYGRRRVELGREERMVREAMRREMATRDGDGTPELARQIDRLLLLQRRRLDIVEEEQRALAAFLTPMQRARYMAFEEELQRRADEMRHNSESGRSGGRSGPPSRDTTGGPPGRPPVKRIPPPSN